MEPPPNRSKTTARRPGVVELYRQAFRGLPAPVWWLASAAFVQRCGTMVVPFLTLYLTTQRGYDVAEAGLVLAGYGLGAAGGIAVGGRLADRLGPFPVQVASFLFGGAGFLLLGAARGGLAVAGATVLLGALLEAFRPANNAAFALAAPPGGRSQAFGLYRLALNLGMAVGPALGGVLALVDYRWLFVANALACWLAAGVLVLRAPRQRPGDGTAEDGEGAEPAGSPWKDRVYLAVLGLLFLQGLVFFQLMGTLPLYLRTEMELPESVVGLVFTVNTVLIVAFEMVLVRLVRDRDPLRVAAFAALCFGLGYGLLPWGAGTVFVLLTVAIWTLGEMLSAPVMMTFAADRAGPRSLGRYMAAFNLCFAAASIAAPSLGTLVWSWAGPRAVWHGALVIGFVLFAGFSAVAARARA